MTEEQRLSTRATLKAHLAEALIAKRRYQELASEIAACGRAKEMAANAHTTATEPLQAELREVQSRIGAAMVAGSPPTADDEARYQELHSAIRAENEKLQGIIAVQDRMAHQLAEQREKLIPDVSEVERLRANLMRHPLGNPDLLAEKFSLSEEIKFTQPRVQAAQKNVAKYEQALADAAGKRMGHETQELWEANLRNWRHELLAASSAVAQAQSEMEATLAAIENE